MCTFPLIRSRDTLKALFGKIIFLSSFSKYKLLSFLLIRKKNAEVPIYLSF